MASTYNNLYSVGPGSLGPGTHVTQSLLDPQNNRGTITRIYEDATGIDVSQLASLYTLSDSVYPGTSILLDSTYVRQISDTLALVISRYGGNSGTNFKTVMTRTPGAYRQTPFYDVTEAYDSDPGNYIGPLNKGVLRPKAITTIDMMVISWSSIVYSDFRPNDNYNLIGKVNSNSYTIDGYGHAAETLKFGGTRIRHDKYGGYDRWTLSHTATYDPLYKHRDSEIDKPAKPRDNGTWDFTLSNNGNGVQNNQLVAFPNLP